MLMKKVLATAVTAGLVAALSPAAAMAATYDGTIDVQLEGDRYPVTIQNNYLLSKASVGDFGVLYHGNGQTAYSVIGSETHISLKDFFAAAGTVYSNAWESGASLTIYTTDSETDPYSTWTDFSYDLIEAEDNYFYPNTVGGSDGTDTSATPEMDSDGNPITVPATIALNSYSGSLSDYFTAFGARESLSSLAKNRIDGPDKSPRLLWGASPADYTGHNVAGRKFPSNITKIVITPAS